MNVVPSVINKVVFQTGRDFPKSSECMFTKQPEAVSTHTTHSTHTYHRYGQTGGCLDLLLCLSGGVAAVSSSDKVQKKKKVKEKQEVLLKLEVRQKCSQKQFHLNEKSPP